METIQPRITVDTSQYPVFSVRYPSIVDKPMIDDYIVSLSQVFERAKREKSHLAGIADVSDVKILKIPADVRKYLFESLAKIDTQYPGIAVCDAVIVMQGFSSVINTIVTMYGAARGKRNHVTRYFGSLKEARAWAHLTLGKFREKLAG